MTIHLTPPPELHSKPPSEIIKAFQSGQYFRRASGLFVGIASYYSDFPKGTQFKIFTQKSFFYHVK